MFKNKNTDGSLNICLIKLREANADIYTLISQKVKNNNIKPDRRDRKRPVERRSVRDGKDVD